MARDSGKDGASTSFVPPNAVEPEMTASAVEYAAVKMLSKPFLIESVRTYVPLTIATPRTIAIAVSAARSLRPSNPFSATRITR